MIWFWKWCCTLNVQPREKVRIKPLSNTSLLENNAHHIAYWVYWNLATSVRMSDTSAQWMCAVPLCIALLHALPVRVARNDTALAINLQRLGWDTLTRMNHSYKYRLIGTPDWVEPSHANELLCMPLSHANLQPSLARCPIKIAYHLPEENWKELVVSFSIKVPWSTFGHGQISKIQSCAYILITVLITSLQLNNVYKYTRP